MTAEWCRSNFPSTEAEPLVYQFVITAAGDGFSVGSTGASFRRSDYVREGGVEPPRPFGHRILSPARLPGSATLAETNVLVREVCQVMIVRLEARLLTFF
jgi:hypothetical protein